MSPSTNVLPRGVTQQGEVSATGVTPLGFYSSLSFSLSHSLYNNVTSLLCILINIWKEEIPLRALNAYG
jgi:hypothetical protein